MTYTITEACIGEKDRSCVDVCPVDCIHDDVHSDGVDEDASADRILYIDPDECIDCGACEHVAAPRRQIRRGRQYG